MAGPETKNNNGRGGAGVRVSAGTFGGQLGTTRIR
jgi:hypothetical protein